ncbi:UPF0489 family protein [Pseudomonas sp. 460]|uniref:UPF0489 family protein n=1 Tax=Pseudomonas sp. 460 TaxID=2485142 RepID=UPI00104D7E91|nr:UPF0489 family protein [Pseudomonas sp. 460]TCV51615.1 uncharacterized protein UPF0489 [Pseudomonas sp. 460]
MRQVQTTNITNENINGKAVFTFDSHHEALLPWAQCARDLGISPRLLTLDYHCDTRPAFIGHSAVDIAADAGDEDWESRAAVEVAKIDFRDEDTVREAILKLRFDEHISAAVQSGIIDIAFAIVGGSITNEFQSNEQSAAEAEWRERAHDTPWVPMPKAKAPYTYSIPDERIIELPHQKVRAKDHPPSRMYADMALESTFLSGRLNFIETITKSSGVPGLFEAPFILDIDLDYFNTRKAVQPADHLVFHQLIRRAQIITIAREPKCVTDLQKPGEKLTSDWLEAELKRHIREALSTSPSEDDLTTPEQTSA